MYRIEIENRCLRELKKLDRAVVKRAFALIQRVIVKAPYRGKQLKGKYSGLFSYRISDYRIVYEIVRETLTIGVIRIAQQKSVYNGI